MFPIKNYNYGLPFDGPASFGAKRKFDIHTGVDLYCDVGTKIHAIESGMVIGIEIFTGPNAGSPWWNETFAVLVESQNKVILYGELETKLNIGDYIKSGDIIGSILQVLKKDKGKPLSMLHIEQYKLGTTKSVWWYHNEPQPHNLINITPLLQRYYEKI